MNGLTGNIKNTTWRKALPQVFFWMAITLLFLYERRYLIEKAGLPNFFACVSVRLLLIMGLAYLNLYLLIPQFISTRKYWLYGALILLSLMLYVGSQSAYDMFLFGFIIGDARYSSLWYTLPYNLISSAWYLLITVSFKISFDWLQNQKAAHIPGNTASIKTETLEYIYFKSGLKTVKTRVNAILYIQALKDYSIVYLTDEKIIIKGTLKYIEGILPAGDFVRIHKSYIIAKNKIVAVERTKVLLSAQVSIPVGRNYQNRLAGF